MFWELHQAAIFLINKLPCTKKCESYNIAPTLFITSPQPENDSMAAFGIDPVDIFMRTSNPAASTLVTTFIADMHPDVFPLINLCRAENRAYFIWTVCHTYLWIFHMEMRFRVSVETDEVLLFFDGLSLLLFFAHYFITFQAR